jgi:hypothetical protein
MVQRNGSARDTTVQPMGSGRAGDVDGDGRDEFVSLEGVVALGSDGELAPLASSEDNWEPLYADLNGDGRAEVTVTDEQGVTQICLGGSRTPRCGYWRGRAIEGTIEIEPAGDLDGDGFADVLVHDLDACDQDCREQRSTYRVVYGGRRARRGPSYTQDALDARASGVGDVDGDGRGDVVEWRGDQAMLRAGSARGLRRGRALVRLRGACEHRSAEPAGDLDGDGDMEVLLCHGARCSLVFGGATPRVTELGYPRDTVDPCAP